MRKAGFEIAALRMGVATVLLTVGGCSSVPDSINPAEWYRSASSWISPGEETKSESDTVAPAAQQAEREASFPSLASVPQRPAGTVDPAARGSLVDTMRRDSEEGRREAEALDARTDRLVDSRELPPQAPPSTREDPPLPPPAITAAGPSATAPAESATATAASAPQPVTAPAQAPSTTAAFAPGQRLAPRPPVMPPQPVSVGLSG